MAEQGSRILITGTGSGLGRYLRERFGGDGFTREQPAAHTNIWPADVDSDSYDALIHCASNAAKDVGVGGLYDYLNDNVLLTERLTRLCHGKFIFMSTISVYPPGGGPRRESDPIPVDRVQGLYALSKLMSEVIVRQRCPDHLVLRLSLLLGPYSRDNATFKILRGTTDTIPLSGESEVIYIRYEDVEAFVRAALERDLRGVYNLAASDSMRLDEVARLAERRVSFGERLYTAGSVDNSRAASILPALECGSREMLQHYLTR